MDKNSEILCFLSLKGLLQNTTNPKKLDREILEKNVLYAVSTRLCYLTRRRGSKVLPLVWCGSLERQVLSSPSDRGPKLRGCLISRSSFCNPKDDFTDKLGILEREKEKAIKIYGNDPNVFPWSGLKLKQKIRGTLKEASEKNNALRRLKPRFKGRKN
ncbi:hypothetical protein AVEN_150216-1 [Araneus ventricosus]|uniref:Uncharacterized protein n=1 Tax=Araneus ventricosus TaxID=182803 RepID=A0A4Y2UA97_ARAVE|nr:hypothetical protein AVEN_150216-1 [Araneus ventricosus]